MTESHSDRESSPVVDGMIEQLEMRRDDLRRFVKGLLGPTLRGKIEADDIIQEVSAHVFANAGEVDAGDRDPFGWFCQIARHKVMDAARRFQAMKRDSRKENAIHAPGGASVGLEHFLAASITTPTQAVSRQEKEHSLVLALAQLPEEQKMALSLRYLENLPSREISQRIGKSDGATRVLLTRALKKLEQIIRQSHPDWTIAQQSEKA